MRKPITTVLTTISAAALLLGLAACSGGETDAPTKAPTASATEKALAAPKTGSCVDGQLLIADKDLREDAFTVDGACERIAVLTEGATITITSDVKLLSVEGSGNTIDATTIGQVAVLGQNATIKHTGKQPVLADTGLGTPKVDFVQK